MTERPENFAIQESPNFFKLKLTLMARVRSDILLATPPLVATFFSVKAKCLSSSHARHGGT